MTTGRIFDIKRFAIHDGPGIRTTLFLKGCPLSCIWCHNPEGLKSEPEIAFDQKKCLAGCALCREACPNSALSLKNGGVEIDAARCLLCGTCAEACPSLALTLIGYKMSPTKAAAEIERDRAFFEESGGGVTFSGGEPLLQPEFLKEVLKLCRKQGIHTCLDTCGYAPPSALRDISGYVDLFLYDLKMVDSEKHTRFTGVSNRRILTNLVDLCRSGRSVVVRIPLIPGLNDGREDMRSTGEFLGSLEGLKSVRLLPYHDIARDKYRRLGGELRLGKDGISGEPKAAGFIKILEGYGLDVRLGSES
jgi:pyruvate formate lyase activating enzyme